MLGRKFSGMFAGTTDLNVEVGSVEAQEIIVSSPFPTALPLFYLEESQLTEEVPFPSAEKGFGIQACLKR